MEGSYKTERQKQLLRSEHFELPIVYGVGLPLMQPKLTSILESLEKVRALGEVSKPYIEANLA